MRRLVVVAASILLLAACATTSAPLATRTASLSMHDFMKLEIDPAANIVFAGGGEVDDAAGSKKVSPETAAKWKQAAKSAVTLQDAGHILLTAPRARAEADWSKFSQMMIDAGADAEKAATTQNSDAAFEAGGKLYDACAGCHGKFIAGRS